MTTLKSQANQHKRKTYNNTKIVKTQANQHENLKH